VGNSKSSNPTISNLFSTNLLSTNISSGTYSGISISVGSKFLNITTSTLLVSGNTSAAISRKLLAILRTVDVFVSGTLTAININSKFITISTFNS
jgi:hypothetical protein